MAARGRGSSAAARGRGTSARNVLKKDKVTRYNSSSYDSDSDSDSELRSSPSGARSSTATGITSRGKVFEGIRMHMFAYNMLLCNAMPKL